MITVILTIITIIDAVNDIIIIIIINSVNDLIIIICLYIVSSEWANGISLGC